MGNLASMTTRVRILLPLGFACLFATACRDVIDPAVGGGSVVLDVVFTGPVRSVGIGGPAASTRIFPPLEQVDVILDGPIDTVITLTMTASAFEGTIDGLPVGTYSLVAVGRAAGLVTFYGRNPSVQVTAGVTTNAPITFSSFVSTLNAVPPRTTQFTQALGFSPVSAANAYTIEVARSPNFVQPVSIATTATTALVAVTDIGTYFARVRAINADVSAGESSFSDVQSWEVVVDSTTGADAGTAFDLGARGTAAGLYTGYNIFPNVEEDWFSLTLAAGDQVTAAVKTTSLSPPSDLNPTIRLLGSGGATIAMNDDNGGGVESLLSGTIPTAGTYNLVVGSSSQSSVGHYQLDVTHFASVASVTIDPAAATILQGGTLQLSARTFDGAGVELTGKAITWSSEDASVAAVDATGLVSGVANGTVGIIARSEGVTGRSDITVSASVITVLPDRDTLISIGETVTLTAAGGAGPITWTSSDAAVASIDAAGLVTAVGNGTTTITANDGNIQGNAVIVVQQQVALFIVNGPVGGLAGQRMSPDPTVTLTDALGSGVAGVTLTFAVTLGNGLVEGAALANVTTNAAGVASVAFVPGIEPDQAIDLTGPGVSATFNVSGYFGGQGTAMVDGVQDAGEWAPSWCLGGTLSVPEGGTTPGQVCFMNNATNLYMMLWFDRVNDPNSAVTANFDINGSGVIDAVDAYSFVVQQSGVTTLEVDGHWYDNAFDPACPVGQLCGDADDVHGGTLDGLFQGSNDGTRTTYEFEIPLNSGDVLDIAVAPGTLIDMLTAVRILDGVTGTPGSALSGFPSSGFLRVLIF